MNINNFISNNIFLLFVILILILLYFKLSIDKISKEQFTEIDTTDDSIVKSVNRILKADIHDIIILTNIAKDLMKDNIFEFKDKLTIKKESNYANNKLKMNIDGSIATSGIICINNNLPTNKDIGVRTNKLYSDTYIATGYSDNTIKNKISNDGSASFANGTVTISSDGTLNIPNKVVIGNKYTIESSNGNLTISNDAGRILLIQSDRNIYFDKVSRKNGYGENINSYASNFIFNNTYINLFTIRTELTDRALVQTFAYNHNENDGPAAFFDGMTLRDFKEKGQLLIKFY